MDTNVKYKSSLFSFLFSDPDLLRELYCALDNVTLPADVPVTINTLQDVLFMDMLNDISFSIGDKLVILIEHQSTINPNMALRLLMYVARVYEKMLNNKKIYASKLQKIPRPEFFVLYNGTAPYPDEGILKLSGAFEQAAELGIALPDSPALELVVRVININHGKNEAIVKKCRKLSEYGAFVAKARELEKASGNLGDAIRQAVVYCRDHDILKEFLETHGTEVLNMLMTEWNWDDALAYRFEEGREEGWEKGLEKGLEKGREKERKENVRNMFAMGMDIEVIAQALKWPIEKIRSFVT